MKTTFLRLSAALVALALSALGAARMPSAQGLPTWTSHGPEGGDVISLAIDPNTDNTLCGNPLRRSLDQCRSRSELDVRRSGQSVV